MSKVVYRSGDFSKKSEKLGELGCSRSTGYFGTGYYFVTDWEKCCHLGNGHRPLYKFDVSEYNLIYGTLELHKALKEVNRYITWYPFVQKDLTNIHNLCKEIDSFIGTLNVWNDKNFLKVLKDLYKESLEYGSSYKEMKEDYLKYVLESMSKVEELKEVYNILNSDEEPDWEELEDLLWENRLITNTDFIDNIKSIKRNIFSARIELGCDESQFDDICSSIYKELCPTYVVGDLKAEITADDESDSIPTRFLKKLGYEGVYPSNECDNSTYGGCIFDLDKIKDLEKLCDDASKYEESKMDNRTRIFESIYEDSNFEDFWKKVMEKVNLYNVEDKDLDFVKKELRDEVEKYETKEFGSDSEVLFKARVDTIFHRVGLVEKESEPLAFEIFDIMVGEEDD